jgi:hypothetical protein
LNPVNPVAYLRLYHFHAVIALIGSEDTASHDVNSQVIEAALNVSHKNNADQDKWRRLIVRWTILRRCGGQDG